MQGIVSRMRELAVESSNGTLGTTERGYIQTEFTQLSSEINRISSITELQRPEAARRQRVGGPDVPGRHQQHRRTTASSMSITKLSDVERSARPSLHIAVGEPVDGDQRADRRLGAFDAAIKQLSTARANVGAVQNRMQVTVSATSRSRRRT